MKKTLKITVFLLLLCAAFSIVSCSKAVKTDSLKVSHDKKFGGVYAEITIEDFMNLGFEFGDSVDISFNNGYKMENIPFYDGFYTEPEKALICGYEGYPYIKICINYGKDLYELAKLSDDNKVTLTLNKKGAYSDIYNSMKLSYSNEREDFASDEAFANFRMLENGNIKEGLIFRSASLSNNEYKRADTVQKLCENSGIEYIIDLGSNQAEIDGYSKVIENEYWQNIYKNEKILPLNMSMNYRDSIFSKSVCDGIRAISDNDGPILIHCTEGKDRTGFFCMIIEALAGYSADEIIADYMKSYENYYGVTKENKPETYKAIETINIDCMLRFICNKETADEISASDLFEGAKNYLIGAGMKNEEITNVVNSICK